MDQLSFFDRYDSYSDTDIPWLACLPTSWESKDLKYVSTINPCSDRAKKHELITFLPMEAVTAKGGIDGSRVGQRGGYPGSLTEFRLGDVILAKITPCFENGKAAYVENLATEKCIGSTEFHVIRPVANLLEPRFLYYLVDCLVN